MDEIVTELEKMRKKVLIFTIIPLLLIIAGFIIVPLTNIGFYGLVFPAVGIIMLICSGSIRKKYSGYYKSNIVKVVLDSVFDNLTFDPSDGISYETIKNTGMISMGNIFRSNDLITGAYHGVDFIQSDVTIEEETRDADGNTSTTTIFSGRWMIFNFNKQFHCDIQICSKWFGAAKRKIFGAKFQRIKLENENFNKAFRVFSQNQEEAFYILTPQMMEALMELKTNLKAQIMLMFVDGTLHIAVDNHKDAFEPPILRKIDPDKERENALKDTNVITAFVDKMKMDNNIYK